ncbi:MAG: formimidoylglutamate deiminase [Crocinitomicaceae bacterium]
MKTFFLRSLLQKDGWHHNQYVRVDAQGRIVSISSETETDHLFETVEAWAIPGFQNAHSHAFQYAMAGLAERHATGEVADDFWSWREAMYRLALRISPDDLQAIAAQLYAEMLRHGYTDVAEFHYVHHDQSGVPYSNLSEMGERLVAAASEVGIGITLIPIFYQKGGFGQAAVEGQKRFLSSTVEDYFELYAASQKSCDLYEHAQTAVGIHSMRGVEPTDIQRVAKEGDQKAPFHIHVSEQLKEIEASLAYLKKRPVEWMLENIDLNSRYHFVHATHLTNSETEALAKSGTHVVLCPSTEGNLGDGIFPLKSFQSFGGKWSIGTDSHVGLNPFEELRLLDYGQRLLSHKRNTFTSTEEGDSGKFAVDMAVLSGRKAMGNLSETYFGIGDTFDAVLFKPDHPLIAATSESNMLSTFIYSTDSRMQYGTISKGKLQVKEGRHIHHSKISQDFKQLMQRLKNR